MKTLSAVCLAAFTPLPVMAHVGGHGGATLREWHLRGGHHIHASFHSFRGDSIILENAKGHIHTYAIAQFSTADRAYANERISKILQVNQQRVVTVSVAQPMLVLGTDPVSIDSSFIPFKPGVKTHWDATYFYVESDGMPTAMPAMKGITAWQQQVPLPQNYTGSNAWAIPLNPVVADSPVNLHTALHTGAVAVAANGLPIFNPENNRGEFSQDIGELDAFGGHCGRADDYHYHIAPVHLAPTLGTRIPIAWAFDGYPIFAYTEPDGSEPAALDEHLGHLWGGTYHYHAIKVKPYMIASLRGKVTVQNDQIVPQARTTPLRPAGTPLKGAVITDLRKCDAQHYALKYTVNGSPRWVNYEWNDSNTYTFRYVRLDSARKTEVYKRK